MGRTLAWCDSSGGCSANRIWACCIRCGTRVVAISTIARPSESTLRLATSTFRGSDNVSATGYCLRTTNPLDTVGKSLAFGAVLAYPNDPLDLRIGFQEIQENYAAAVGFTRRTGFRNINPQMSFAPRPTQHSWIRRFNSEPR